jgi:Cu(I)/Ag(I) efflux system membrane fusion protein
MLAQGKGRYRPAEVKTGREANDQIEILAGLAPGEEVIVSGQFLIDSEASLAGLDVRPINQAPAAPGTGTKQPAKPQTYNSTGTIHAIRNGSVELDMAALPALKWPAMRMTFAAASPTQLRGLKVGDRVNFSFTMESRGQRLQSIAKAPR